MQRPVIAARPRVLATLIAFITSRTARPVRFRVEHRVQRFLDRAAHHLPQMVLDPRLVNPDHFTRALALLIVVHQIAPSSSVEGAANIKSDGMDLLFARVTLGNWR